MISYAIMYISLLMIVTSLLAVEWRMLPEAVSTYQVQSVLIALVFASKLFHWTTGAVLLERDGPGQQRIVIPWLLRRYVLRYIQKKRRQC
jgi:hydrogenase-4 membrane subunit HyfE